MPPEVNPLNLCTVISFYLFFMLYNRQHYLACYWAFNLGYSLAGRTRPVVPGWQHSLGSQQFSSAAKIAKIDSRPDISGCFSGLISWFSLCGSFEPLRSHPVRKTAQWTAFCMSELSVNIE